MNKKNIAKVIERKVNDWLSSLELEADIRPDIIVTGGCIASMLLEEKINDFDIYFRTKETTILVAKYYAQKFMRDPPPEFTESLSQTVNYEVKTSADRVWIDVTTEKQSCLEDLISDEFKDWLDKVLAERPGDMEKYRPLYLTKNAITLADKVQLVLRFYGEPNEIHKNYDFIHCYNYWTYASGLVLHPLALESILTKELKYMGSLYPICSIFRTRKFMSRGWIINAGQLLKMACQVWGLELDNPSVMCEQLTGVDTLLFNNIVERLDSKIDMESFIRRLDEIF